MQELEGSDSNGQWYISRLLERCKPNIKATSTRKKRKLF
jgi:hypothetical protein